MLLSVATSDERLSVALHSLLAHVEGARIVDGAEPCVEQSVALVVTTVSDRTPAEVHTLAQQGRTVLVLAPVPRVSQERAYLNAGAAAYLVMATDGKELLEAVRSALSRTSDQQQA